MHDVSQWKSVDLLDQRMDIIGHDRPGDQPVTLAVEMLERICAWTDRGKLVCQINRHARACPAHPSSCEKDGLHRCFRFPRGLRQLPWIRIVPGTARMDT